MIKRKLKKCIECGKDSHIFGYKMCKPCYSRKFLHPIAKNTPPKKVSDTQKERTKRYLKLRSTFMANNPICQCCNLEKSTELHHKQGRIGDNLFNHFLALCNGCHVRIELNPDWAKENGYSESRLNEKKDDSLDSSGG